MATPDNNLPTPTALKARVKALGLNLVVADDGAKFVLGGDTGRCVVFQDRGDADEFEQWLGSREAVARQIEVSAAELVRLVDEYEAKDVGEVINRLRDFQYIVYKKGADEYRVAREGWTGKGLAFFAALTQLVEPIQVAASNLQSKGGAQ